MTVEYTSVRNHRGLVCDEICETKTRHGQHISCSLPESINIILTVSPLFYHSARENCFSSSCVPSVASCSNGNYASHINTTLTKNPILLNVLSESDFIMYSMLFWPWFVEQRKLYFFVLFTICWQILWSVYFWFVLPLHCSITLIIPSPTKLRRDIETLPSVRPSFRNILVNTLESTSFNGF